MSSRKKMNKLVLISGSSRGLGAAMAQSFSEAVSTRPTG